MRIIIFINHTTVRGDAVCGHEEVVGALIEMLLKMSAKNISTIVFQHLCPWLSTDKIRSRQSKSFARRNLLMSNPDPMQNLAKRICLR